MGAFRSVRDAPALVGYTVQRTVKTRQTEHLRLEPFTVWELHTLTQNEDGACSNTGKGSQHEIPSQNHERMRKTTTEKNSQ